MLGMVVRVSAIAASALLGGAVGAGAAFLITYIVTTEVIVMGEGAILLTLMSAPVGFFVGGLVFGVGAYWLIQAWSKDDWRPHE